MLSQCVLTLPGEKPMNWKFHVWFSGWTRMGRSSIHGDLSRSNLFFCLTQCRRHQIWWAESVIMHG